MLLAVKLMSVLKLQLFVQTSQTLPIRGGVLSVVTPSDDDSVERPLRLVQLTDTKYFLPLMSDSCWCIAEDVRLRGWNIRTSERPGEDPIAHEQAAIPLEAVKPCHRVLIVVRLVW